MGHPIDLSMRRLALRRGTIFSLTMLLSIYLGVGSAQQKPAPTQPAVSQSGPSNPAKAAASSAAPDVSKEALVFDQLHTRIRVEADGAGSRETTARVRILADAGVKEMAVLTFTYTASNQQVVIAYVRVRKPDGTVVTTPDYNIQDMPADVTREAPMYSDIHQKHVAVKGLSVGDTLEYQMTLRTLKAEIPGQFWFEYTFEKNLVILDEQLELDMPDAVTATVASADAQPAVTTNSGRKVYHWSSSNLSRPDPDAPAKSTKHWKPSVQVTTFKSWEQIGDWYQSLQRDRTTVTPAIQAKAAALTKGLASDDDKIRAIFKDVALHIHYVGLDFGIGRYQPHSADDVLSNEYGDCKDKHTLLAALLKAAGIEAWPVLIPSGREIDPAMPSPAQFDHVITVVPRDGKLLWMDSTAEVAPVGVLLANLRDKQALAVPTGKPAHLEHTPVDLPFASSIQVQADGTLSDQGVFTGHLVHTYHGDVEILFRTIFRQVPQSQWKEAIQRVSNATGYAGEVSNPKVSEIEKTEEPFRYSYDYTREKYGDWDNHRISPPLPPVGMELAPGVKEIKPADDPELGALGESFYTATVKIPEHWTLIPPKGTDVKEDWAEYHTSYSFKDGVFTAQRRVQIKKNKVPLDQWDKYLEFRRAVYQDESQMTVILSAKDAKQFQDKIDEETAFAPEIVPGQYTGALSYDLKQEMMTAMQPLRDASLILESDPPPSAADIAKALSLARKGAADLEAKSATLAPGEMSSLYWTQMLAYGWSTLGWAELENKDLAGAENYLHAAWRLGEDKMSGYQLARVLEKKGEKAAAEHLFKLANISSIGNSLGGYLHSDYNLEQRIGQSYLELTGMHLTSTPLKNGAYNGSLREELDKQIEIHGVVRTTKLTGEAYYVVAYEPGKLPKAQILQGEKGFEGLTTVLEGARLHAEFPKGSKARLLREVRLVCSPYGGCDAYMLLPTSIQTPPTPIRPGKVIQLRVAP